MAEGRKGRGNPLAEMLANMPQEQRNKYIRMFGGRMDENEVPIVKIDEEGQYEFDFAQGGKVCRGRKAASSAEKTR
jgi:hypothetical protein|tara:strand:- start:1076 stop:1303 length:228 start_codon:yes stop_codon:yes gene_type:complete